MLRFHQFRPLISASAVAVLAAHASAHQSHPDWTKSLSPFKIAGNLYYVGSRDLASYLIVTGAGNILINSNLESSATQIKNSVEALGFKFSDTKLLLVSHAHFDHCAGSAKVKRLSGAKYWVMKQDVPIVESDGPKDFQKPPDSVRFPSTPVDHVLHDGEVNRLGNTQITAVLTPGHTPGCTTFTMNVMEGNHTYRVVIIGSPNVNPGYRFVGKPSYPGILEDYQKTFNVLKRLSCDIFLVAHGSYFGLLDKVKVVRSKHRNPFVDPAGYKSYVKEAEKRFLAELAKQQRGKK